MKHLLGTGLFRILCTAVFSLLTVPALVEAASWQWSSLPGRERVELQLDAGATEQGATRTGSNTLEVALSAPPTLVRQGAAGPGPDSLIEAVESQGNGVRLSLRSPAFGYIVQRRPQGRVVIEVFPDAFGTRWQPSDAQDGVRPPVPSQQEATATAPPTVNAPGPVQTSPATPAPRPAAPAQGQPPQPAPGAATPAARPGTPATPAARTTAPATIPAVTPVAVTPPVASTATMAVSPPPLVPPPAVQGVIERGTWAVAAGQTFPVQNDPPSSTMPSNAVLHNITSRIESLPPVEQIKVEDHADQAVVPIVPQIVPPVVDTPVLPVQPAVTLPPVETPQGRLIAPSGNGLRARVSTGGPADWPAEEGLSSALPKEPEPQEVSGKIVIPETRQQVAQTEAKKAAPEVELPILYVDEQGNPVPKPVDTEELLAEAKKLMQTMQYPQAQALLEQLKDMPLPPEKREEVLYMLSDAIIAQYTNKWVEGFEPVAKSTSEAMNSNLRSPRVARALERLGLINLRTGNQQDAAGYFAALRQKFPTDPEVPASYYALGKDQLDRGQYAEAVQSFQVVMQEYPESRAVRDSARYMAEALYKQGHYERAMTIIDFVDRRWPRIYLDDPSYLLMVADTQYRRARLDDALQTYWIYYNLLPSNKDNDRVLLHMGTIYLLQNDLQAARELFGELLRVYPESPYAPVVVQRQGEEGIFDGNLSLDALFDMFSRPNMSTLPEVAYTRILKDYPQSDQAVTAALRLAVWKLWSKEYAEAMDMAEKFIAEHPGSGYTPRADEIILRAFAVELAMDLGEQNYDRILSRFERFPQIRGAYAEPDDELRVALARAHLNRGNEQTGFDLLQKFLATPQDPKFGEYVYKLNLARDLRMENWEGLVNLGEKVADWKLPEDERHQLNYAMAIAYENLGRGSLAVPLWGKLYQRDDIPLYQKAYATYFMARDAERRRNIKDAYQLNHDTLKLFSQLEEEGSDRADPERVRESLAALMDVTEVANRFAEALEWAEQYSAFVPEESPDYAGLRFRVARLHRKMGDLAKWQNILEGIIKREPDSVFGRMAASELRTHEVARDLSRYAPPAPGS